MSERSQAIAVWAVMYVAFATIAAWPAITRALR